MVVLDGLRRLEAEASQREIDEFNRCLRELISARNRKPTSGGLIKKVPARCYPLSSTPASSLARLAGGVRRIAVWRCWRVIAVEAFVISTTERELGEVRMVKGWRRMSELNFCN